MTPIRTSCRMLLILGVMAASRAFAEPSSTGALKTPAETSAVLSAHSPQNAKELRLIQAQVQRVVKQVLPATVGVEVRMRANQAAAGSGVIVNKEGLVLTAAHVVERSGRRAWVELSDGRRLSAHTLGANHDVDAGMMKIDDPPLDLPFAPISEGPEVANGEWVITIGQPGGVIEHRTPPVRLGRVLFHGDGILCTDCKLVGGDSGGPLFNMQGEVVGIHSSIGPLVTHNFHVPMTSYRKCWHRLLAGEVWGNRYGDDDRRGGPQLGVRGGAELDRCLIAEVFPGSGAEQAGLKAGDVITAVEGRRISSFDELARTIFFKKPGDKIRLTVDRGGEWLELTAELAGPKSE